MKPAYKIQLLFLLIVMFSHVSAQDESPLQPFFNRVMLNPAFAGLDKQTTFQTGNQFSSIDSASAYNLFYASYDTYSDKLKGGIACYFQQGLIGSKNISTTELGFAYASIPRKTQNGTFRFGVNTNFLLATKQWTVYMLDRITLNRLNDPNPPGQEFLRYILLKPRLSFLWDISTVTWGISLGSVWKADIAAPAVNKGEKLPFNASLYLATNREGFHNGLHTKPFVINPELMFYYKSEYISGRLNLYTEYTNHSLGIFLQSDILQEHYSIGGIIGYATDNLRLNLSAGAGIPGLSKHVGFTGELSLILRVSQFDYTKINPWEPQ